MGVPQSPTPPHLYPQALQLKLYQAFIFSIPILFSIILFLLFYLFYLKRRASNNNNNNNNNTNPSPLHSRPIRSHQTYISSPCHRLDLKVELKDDLPIILFDEELRKKDSQCCVCLGDYIMKEELLQVPSCKHVFHIDCIHLWLHTNTTCPLCRCSVFPATATPPKLTSNPNPSAATASAEPLPPQPVSNQTPPPQVIQVSLEVQHNPQQEEQPIIDRSGITTTTTTNTNENSNNNNMERYFDSGSVVIYIQTHGTSIHEQQPNTS
ncbi:probable E3 ubiquitin-protein ligase RHA4A [Humulus lupulus]|uniref:probable E3 ubiquitin-protein ligase RHA4A n=1 Tax=Humulus lupulus TaxID=3486 RepID=UPI002B4043F5|nr:probable E3 ubiquitin-protein ligase RHA4A [Humulus lupulus]